MTAENIDAEPLVIDDAYAQALGNAVFAFARLEASAVRSCERLRPGSLAELDDRTAGRIADILLALLRQVASPDERAIAAAIRFQALVRSRNNLVHAKPGRDHDGQVRLLRDGDAWSRDEMLSIASAFLECSTNL